MFKKIVPAIAVVATMASCSSMKPMNSSFNRQAAAPREVAKPVPTTDNNSVKFLDDIAVEPASSVNTI